MGDAGAMLTNDAALADRMAMFARHGGLTKGDHQIEGINSRLDGLQAAMLSVKLPHLPAWTKRRQEIAARLRPLLAGIPGSDAAAGRPPDREHVYHLYVVQHEQRDALARHLSELGIQTVINYPVALPFLPAYARLGHRPADFPIAHRHQSRILSLPIFPEMRTEQMDAVTAALASFDGKLAAAG